VVGILKTKEQSRTGDCNKFLSIVNI
jgi:hypothetical protein